MYSPASTYRLQLHDSFDFDRAVGVLDYLRDLGIDWVYISPVLQAEPGSSHGYDVVEHGAIDVGRGGPEALRRLSDAAHDRGMGVLIDIVPNHMGVATPHANDWWWDLLKFGRDSRYADAFDVEWDIADGKVRIPVLGDNDPADTRGELGKLRIDTPGSEPTLCYYDNRYPIAPDTFTGPDDPIALHARQNYELMNWRRADTDLNFRRFFAVNTLAGIRVEEPQVFDESHREVARWFSRGVSDSPGDSSEIAAPIADGLRVDHPDGLAGPKDYLDRLGKVTSGAYTLVEKILEPGEQLPNEWACSGTTGYDALGDFDRVLVDPAGRDELTRLDRDLSDGPEWPDLVHDRKRVVADGILHSEIRRLARLAPDDVRPATAADVLSELAANFGVYRSYLPTGREHLEAAADETRRRRPDLSEPLERLLGPLSNPESPLARRFQQTSGMIMAKGVEDCAYYRYSRLTSLTEVGGDPSSFAIGPGEFHDRQVERLSARPLSMTTLSTHDTKRSENVRATIDVLSEVPGQWADLLNTLLAECPLDDGGLANLLAQAIIGSWPAPAVRLHAYAEKAAREAGRSTLWTAPDAAFEQAMHDFVDHCLGSSDVAAFAESIADDAASNILAAKLLQLAAPGVPDVYQGSESGSENSLVDPDNRRPVDFHALNTSLARIDRGGRPVFGGPDAKLLVTSRVLRLRRDRPDLFRSYRPVRATGENSEHLIGFDRGGAIALATRLPAGLRAAGGWADTTVDVGAHYVDQFTGRRASGTVPLAEIFADYPVALLVPDESAHDAGATGEQVAGTTGDDASGQDAPAKKTESGKRAS